MAKCWANILAIWSECWCIVVNQFCLFYSTQMFFYKMLMPGIEPESSGVGSDRSADCGTTSAQDKIVMKDGRNGKTF